MMEMCITKRLYLEDEGDVRCIFCTTTLFVEMEPALSLLFCEGGKPVKVT